MEITLEQLLQSRDSRQRTQQRLLKAFPSCTLMCMTVIMPGKIKRNKQSLTIAKEAIKSLEQTFPKCIYANNIDIFHKQSSEHKSFHFELDLETGFESYWLVDEKEKQCKLKACEIEDKHPLGRLFDIDIITREGIPLSRESLGLRTRKCLICDKPARLCMRTHAHTYQEIQEFIDKLVRNYPTTPSVISQFP